MTVTVMVLWSDDEPRGPAPYSVARNLPWSELAHQEGLVVDPLAGLLTTQSGASYRYDRLMVTAITPDPHHEELEALARRDSPAPRSETSGIMLVTTVALLLGLIVFLVG